MCFLLIEQFVENPQNKIIPEGTKERIRRSLLERVSLEGICRIFDISMPWLLGFMEKTFQSLPENLHAGIIAENDELWSFVGNKKNDQWLWVVMHAETRSRISR